MIRTLISSLAIMLALGSLPLHSGRAAGGQGFQTMGPVAAMQPATRHRTLCTIRPLYQCYGASGLALLRQRLPQAISPAVAVRRAANLGLTQVGIELQNGRPAALYYLFGSDWFLWSGQPQAPARPRGVLVQEVVGRSFVRRPYVIHESDGTWLFEISLQHHNLSLSVQANMSRKVVNQIGMAVLALDRK